MKYSTALIVAFIAYTTAQSELSDCGRLCVSNMQQQAKELGCDSPDDVACLCGKGDFINGLRDCSGEACGAEEQVKVLNYGAQYCGGAATYVAASISSVAESVSSLATSIASSIAASDASATTTVTTKTGVTTETSSATVTTTEGGAVGGPVPISTRYSLSAIVDGEELSVVSQQTVGTEIIYSSDASATPVSTISNESLTSTLYGPAGHGGSRTTLQTAVSTSEVLSTITNESTTQVTTVGSTTVSSEITATATSEAAGARQTAGAAIAAFAGLAALII